MVLFIITVFSIQIYATWGDLYAMGTVFVRLILITTWWVLFWVYFIIKGLGVPSALWVHWPVG